jgi:hypothetical protein
VFLRGSSFFLSFSALPPLLTLLWHVPQPRVVEKRTPTNRAYVEGLEHRVQVLEAMLRGVDVVRPPAGAGAEDAGRGPRAFEVAETTTPSTVLDEIAQLGERLDDLSVEEVRPSPSVMLLYFD